MKKYNIEFLVGNRQYSFKFFLKIQASMYFRALETWLNLEEAKLGAAICSAVSQLCQLRKSSSVGSRSVYGFVWCSLSEVNVDPNCVIMETLPGISWYLRSFISLSSFGLGYGMKSWQLKYRLLHIIYSITIDCYTSVFPFSALLLPIFTNPVESGIRDRALFTNSKLVLVAVLNRST